MTKRSKPAQKAKAANLSKTLKTDLGLTKKDLEKIIGGATSIGKTKWCDFSGDT